MSNFKKNEERHQCTMSFRCTDDEKKSLEEIAAAAGCSVSDVIRKWIAKGSKKLEKKMRAA